MHTLLLYIELLQETITIQGSKSTWYVLYKLQTPSEIVETDTQGIENHVQ